MTYVTDLENKLKAARTQIRKLRVRVKNFENSVRLHNEGRAIMAANDEVAGSKWKEGAHKVEAAEGAFNDLVPAQLLTKP